MDSHSPRERASRYRRVRTERTQQHSNERPPPPPNAVKTVAEVLGITETCTPDGRIIDGTWLLSVQGDYAVASHNRASTAHISKPEKMSKHCFETLHAMTSTVVHLPTRQVVRVGGPPTVKFCARDIAASGAIKSSRGVSYMSPINAIQNGLTVEFRAEIDAPVVYVWKHRRAVMFSTAKKVDARLVRIGRGRILSEVYAMCGGPTMSDLFPDPDEDDGVCYIFKVCHPDTIGISRVEVGTGYVQIVDVIEPSGESMLQNGKIKDVRWAEFCTGHIIDPSNPISLLGEIEAEAEARAVFETAGDELGSDQVMACTEGGVETDKPVEAGISELTDVKGLVEDLNIEASYGEFAPYPPPSSANFAEPERGNARASADRCLYEGLEGENVPAIYWPSSIPVNFSDPVPFRNIFEVLSRGFYSNINSYTPSSQALANAKGFYDTGECVSVRVCTDSKPVYEYVFMPPSFIRRLLIVNEDTPQNRMVKLFYSANNPDIPSTTLVRGPFVRSTELAPMEVFATRPEILECGLNSGAYTNGAAVPELITAIVPEFETLFNPNLPVVHILDSPRFKSWVESLDENSDMLLTPFDDVIASISRELPMGTRQVAKYQWAVIEYVCALPRAQQLPVLKKLVETHC